MIEEVQQLLGRLKFDAAAIVDDAYDEAPSPDDLKPASWDRFYDDIDETSEGWLREGYGPAKYDGAAIGALARDPAFVSLVWSLRDKLGSKASALFSEFIRQKSQKREALAALERLLSDDLKLSTRKFGRSADAELEKAQIIFLDLFLGADDDPDAVERSIERIRQVVARRRTDPPVVFLMSASPKLGQFASTVRDKAEMLGCQFRTIRKSDVARREPTLEMIYDLIVGYPDSLRVNAFILAWDAALADSRTEFLRQIRTIDLADYANMHGLILEAEEQELGDYVVDLYDLYLHNIIEGHEKLVRAAKELNKIEWGVYPPAQFMPSQVVVDLMDGTLFHNEKRTMLEAEIDADPSALRFGDVFLESAQPATSKGALTTVAPAEATATPAGGASPSASAPAAQPASATAANSGGAVASASQTPESPRRAYVVLSQPCDLARDGVDVALLLRGKATNYEWEQHQGKRALSKTPVMMSGDAKLALDWDPLTPETWNVSGLPERLARTTLKRARRFRLPFALQLQRSFLDGTGRIGTRADLHGHFAAGVAIYFRSQAGKAKLVARTHPGNNDAVCLVGRTKRGPLEWLLLSEGVFAKVREAMADAVATDPPKHDKQKFVDAATSPGFRRAMKGKIEIRRSDKPHRPFAGSDFDIVETRTASKLMDGQDIGLNGAPIIIEIDVH